MQITIIGTGYVGLVTGACLAAAGLKVSCIDIDKNKISKLKKYQVPFYEPGLSKLLETSVNKQRLKFTTSYLQGIPKGTKAIFLCVGTPPDRRGKPNLKFLKDALNSIHRAYTEDEPLIIFIKSTVPVGTNKFAQDHLNKISSDKYRYLVASNPEFLKEGSSINDFKNPDRIIIGTNSKYVKSISKQIYQKFSKQDSLLKFTNIESAELIKYASNTFLATKISFMNELSKLSDKVGGDIDDIKESMGLDPRIGKEFLNAGLGFGGSCLPKDLDGMLYSFQSHQIESYIPNAVKKINAEQIDFFFKKIDSEINLNNAKILFWGAAFKPNTDDIRESQSIKLIKKLVKKKAMVYLYDPKALGNAKNYFLKQPLVKYLSHQYQHIEKCDAVVIGTEWRDFLTPKIRELLKLKQRILFDGRNCIAHEKLTNSGIQYIRIC